jgi:hypothetical protein
MMRRFVGSLVLAAIFAAVPAVSPVAAQVKLPRPSQKASVMQTVGLTDITVTYSRPGVKGRKIWGALVPYGQPWRTGANEATTFACTEDVTIEGQKLPAGTYSLLTIPGADEWTVAFNKEKDLWGAYAYKPESDVLQVKVKPQAAAATEEWMSFHFTDLSWTGATLELQWEKLALALRIGVDDVEQALTAVRDTITRAPADDWRTPYRGASFCLDAGSNLDEGAKWAEKSVAIQEGYFNVSLLARYRAEKGNLKDAVSLAEKAIQLGKAQKEPADTAPTERLLAEWNAKKK